MSKFTELTVYTTHLGSELVSDLMWQYTEHGVAINDVQDVIDLEKTGRAWDYADSSIYSSDKTVLVKGFFPVENPELVVQVERGLQTLKQNSDLDLGTLETAKKEIDGDLWHEQWKEHFKPIHIGKVVIVPEWIDYQPTQGETIVLLDSNMAFGTGEHETTSMCVEFLSEYVKAQDTLLDVGCGSGILGITGAKLGAKRVIMTDIDECAVVASKRNILLNKVENCTVLLKNLLDDNTVTGDVIACNIMAEVLIAFAPHIGRNLNEGGVIILSGILKERLGAVKQAYMDAGFNYVKEKTKGEWSALVVGKGIR